MEVTLLEFRDVWKSFGSGAGAVPVLQGISFALQPGETVALTGESGSGKSTILHLAAALDGTDRGAISLKGQSYDGLDDRGRAELRRTEIGLIFQQFNLIPSLTVGQNLAIQARMAGRETPDWTRDLAERLGLAELLARYPEALSGGQQQRVAIGRALALRPSLILADEPTGNLDEATSDAVLRLLLDLVRETGAALLFVTHSERLAGHLDRRLHLSHGAVSEAPQ